MEYKLLETIDDALPQNKSKFALRIAVRKGLFPSNHPSVDLFLLDSEISDINHIGKGTLGDLHFALSGNCFCPEADESPQSRLLRATL